MATVQTTALILHSQVFFESDKLVECMSPTLGKFKCLAKRAAKSSKQSLALNPLSIVTLTLYKGRSFYLVNQCDLQEGFLDLRKDFNTLQMALFFVTVLRKSVAMEQENAALYTLVEQSLRRFVNKDPFQEVVQGFMYNYLAIEGITPEDESPMTMPCFCRLLKEYLELPLSPPLEIVAR